MNEFFGENPKDVRLIIEKVIDAARARDAARRAKEAITVLAEVANDASAPADVRVEAATVLLAHATQPAVPQKAQ